MDVGINKPFKNFLQEKWVNYLVENRNQAVNGKIPSPSREEISQWVINAAENLTQETITNSWNNPGYEYFVEEHQQEQENGPIAELQEADEVAEYY